MNIRLETKVRGNYKEVMDHFDRKLFEALKPDIGKMEVVEFTGSKKGDRVHLRFVQPFQADWISKIVEDGEDDQKAYFVDTGVKMPFGLQYWRHLHIVKRVDENHSLIVDDMYFKGKNRLHTWLLYPALYVAFYPRKRKYREYFGWPES